MLIVKNAQPARSFMMGPIFATAHISALRPTCSCPVEGGKCEYAIAADTATHEIIYCSPEAVNVSNMAALIDAEGKPHFKYIVEGANLFLTQQARLYLEKRKVILFKDSSANKGK